MGNTMTNTTEQNVIEQSYIIPSTPVYGVAESAALEADDSSFDTTDVYAGAGSDAPEDDNIEGDYGNEPESTPEPEAEPEPEPEADPEPELEAEPTPEPEHKATMIPKERLDTELAKRRQLEAQLAELQAKISPETPEIDVSFDKASDMFNAVLDGDLEKATGAFNEAIRTTAERTAQAVTEQMQGQIKQQGELTKDEMALQAEALVIEQSHPEFDQNSPDFNESLATEAVELRDFYMTRGFTPVQALRKAVDIVAPAQAAAPAPARDTTVNTDEKTAAANAQPPAIPKATTSEKPFDVMTATDEELDKLSDAQMAKLLGNTL